MTTGPKILAFAGSARKDSWNKHMVRIAAVGAQSTSDQSAGAEVTVIDLADYPMPILNLDDEAATGLPPNARKLKDLFLAHQGLLIASPEHNSSISSLLKNTIDWVSRPVPNEPPLACFTDKIAIIMSASPGALGGLRGLVHLRAILGNIGTIVLPSTLSISKVHETFGTDGSLKDETQRPKIEKLGSDLANFLKKLQD